MNASARTEPRHVHNDTPDSLVSRWWRSAVIGVLGGLLAFGASFALSDTYASSTRLLIRGREASFLTDRAESVSQQPGIVDASFAKTLGETQAGVVTSEQMATAVVDRLGLDRKPTKKEGLLTRGVRQGILVYAKTKAVLAHGFYHRPTKREQAISNVHTGLFAKPLKDSYILEIAGTADTPEGARDIANAAAALLVSSGGSRAKSDATRYATTLQEQLATAAADAAAARTAIADYKTAHGITSVENEIALDASAIGELRSQSANNEVNLAGAKSQLKSIEQSLVGLQKTQKGQQVITTGRSETVIASDQPSTVYQQLQQQRDSTVARVAELQARQMALDSRLTSTRQPELNKDQSNLLGLSQTLSIAEQRVVDLSNRYAEARANSANPGAELTRIDQASLPDYPVAPKHYLYLALGLMLGALAGWLLTLLSGGRQDAELRTDLAADQGALAYTNGVTIDVSDESAEPHYVLARAGNRSYSVGNGLPHGDGVSASDGKGVHLPSGASRDDT